MPLCSERDGCSPDPAAREQTLHAHGAPLCTTTDTGSLPRPAIRCWTQPQRRSRCTGMPMRVPLVFQQVQGRQKSGARAVNLCLQPHASGVEEGGESRSIHRRHIRRQWGPGRDCKRTSERRQDTSTTRVRLRTRPFSCGTWQRDVGVRAGHLPCLVRRRLQARFPCPCRRHSVLVHRARASAHAGGV